VHLEAHASGEARIFQAGRDQHLHYGDGVRTRRRVESGTATQECPYPGLAAFGREQARWFFGRDALVAELISRLDERLRVGGVQVVVAPSGAGKSSLLRAGVLPRLDQGVLPGSDRWPKLVFTPTANPLRALAVHLASLTGADPVAVAEEVAADPTRCVSMLRAALRPDLDGDDVDVRVVVVVDQFEELFTLCTDDAQRNSFVELLSQIAGPPPGTGERPVALVVVGVRADFYAACANHQRLRAALQDSPLVVGPMSEVELREAILYPAQDVGLDIEPGLVELLLRDLGATTPGDGDTADYEAGRLPLLAHALRASWQQRHGATLTVAGYQATGGIQRAIATTADRVFSSLDAAGQHIAQSLFLRLTKIGDSTEDTRRRLSRSDLVGTGADAAATTAVLDVFTGARLLTQRQDTVEITHEALLQSWPRLRRWIDTDRAGRLTQQDLEEAAAGWDRGGRDASLLYRGSRLEVANTWAASARRGELSSTARDFLAASIRARRRAARLRTGTVAGVTVLALVASVAAVVAYQQRGEARHQQREALSQRDSAVYNQVIAEADRLRTVDASLSAQLDLVAHRMRPGEDTYTRVVAAANTALSTPVIGHAGAVESVVFSPDGRTLASGSVDQTIRLWNVSDPTRPAPLGQPLTGHTAMVHAVAFSPDGHILASGSLDDTVRLWNVSDPAHPVSLGGPLTGHTAAVFSVAFSPDGRTLASAGLDDTVRLWNVSDPSRPVLFGRISLGAPAVSVAFGPDGHTLATAGGELRLWNVSDPARPASLARPLTGHAGPIESVAFSPDGHTLASASDDQTIRLWAVSDPTHPAPLGRPVSYPAGVVSVRFSPDGHLLAGAGADQQVLVWNVSNPALVGMEPPMAGHTALVESVAFAPDGHTLASASDDGTVRMWNLPPTLLAGHTAAVLSVAFGPDGHTLASASIDQTIRLWDVSDPTRPVPLGRPLDSRAGAFDTVAFSPDGHLLASAGRSDDAVRLWDVSDPTRPAPLGRPLTGHTGAVESVAFSPDGRTLASAGQDRTVRLWDVSDPAHAALLRTLTGHTDIVRAVAFGPDGRTLASAGIDGTIRLWDVSDPARPAPLGQPLTRHTSIVRSLVFSPDGRVLVSAGQDQTIRLWSVSNAAHAALVGTLTGHTNIVYAVAFSPDGHRLASAGGDGTLRLWDVSDPTNPVPFGQSLTNTIVPSVSVAFGPDGRTLASSDLMVRLWSMDVDQAAARICAVTRNTLTAAEWRRHVGNEVPYKPPCR